MMKRVKMDLGKCRSCGSSSPKFILSLGEHPLPNRFLTEEQLQEPEARYPLDLFLCSTCSLVQLGKVVPSEELFSHYAYASSTSATFRAHFEGLADYLMERFELRPGNMLVDIGSNDGVLLRPLRARGIRAIGVEPARNLCEHAWQDGLETLNEFFSKGTVEKVGPASADAVTACNVFAHIENIQGVVKNVKSLLKPGGVFVAEVQYLGAMLRDLTFDNIYVEHIYYWTLGSMDKFFSTQGMEIIEAQEIPTHGGSLRVAVARQGERSVSPGVASMLSVEKNQRLSDLETFRAFADAVEEVREKLPQLLAGLNGRLIGYGAPAKSTTILNYCRLGSDTLHYIVDDSPLKQGLFTPGTHIPVVGPDALEKERPDHILVLAWNFADDIIKKTKYLQCQYVLPVPPRIVKS